MPHTGSCACGQTTVTLAGTHTTQVRLSALINADHAYWYQVLCHCLDCQKESGSAFSANVVELKTNVTIAGPVKEYLTKSESGNTVRHVFCSECGSPISHVSPGFGESQGIRAALFPEFKDIPIAAERMCSAFRVKVKTDDAVFVRSRWPVIPEFKDSAKIETM
ncbi:GFA domain-containing protein [Mycena indigotica]|uniref:GFA domain-containing protein n=1 Tax=Mycena indigotica TaxID=2126181 RepID=A0A8H6S6F2_9AGAR|nr:GFA domain-containing protein [Mycena indigotica]KAF7292165.1 GFA domain-containing protein [Mycena indigotica]